jgi:ATPase subunit of ABC transporter with duplicated ATPase domains
MIASFDAIDRVLYIENRAIHAYAGNYRNSSRSAPRNWRCSRRCKAAAEACGGNYLVCKPFSGQRHKIAAGSKPIKMLERMERTFRACRQPIRVRVCRAAQDAAPAVDDRGRRLRLWNTRTVSGINASIGPQDRIALLGPNGCGKST